jgi:hypothetical protein
LARTELLQELKIGLYKGFQFSIKIIGNIKALTLAMKLMPFNFANEYHRQQQTQMSLKATKHG